SSRTRHTSFSLEWSSDVCISDLASIPFKVGKIQKGSEAERGGLKEGDFITAIEGQPVRCFQELKSVLDENAGEKIALEVERKERSEERRVGKEYRSKEEIQKIEN